MSGNSSRKSSAALLSCATYVSASVCVNDYTQKKGNFISNGN